LLVDLQQPQPERALIDRLRHDFGNLRDITGSDAEMMKGASLAEPVAQRLSETLHDVVAARPDVQLQCDWLQKALQRFLSDEDPRGLSNSCDGDDDIPW
jgi:hypothetical protein